MIKTKEHYDLLEQFERDFPYCRLDKEPKDLWGKEAIYQNGNTNELFLAYRKGYAFGKVVNDND